MATVISTTCDLLTPISSESLLRVSRKLSLHLIEKVLSFVITFSPKIVITFFVITFFVITFYLSLQILSLHFYCSTFPKIVITFVSTMIVITNCLILSLHYNIITFLGLSRG